MKLKAARVCLFTPPSQGFPGTGPYPGYSTPMTCTLRKSLHEAQFREYDQDSRQGSVPRVRYSHDMHVQKISAHKLSSDDLSEIPGTGPFQQNVTPMTCTSRKSLQEAPRSAWKPFQRLQATRSSLDILPQSHAHGGSVLCVSSFMSQRCKTLRISANS